MSMNLNLKAKVPVSGILLDGSLFETVYTRYFSLWQTPTDTTNLALELKANPFEVYKNWLMSDFNKLDIIKQQEVEEHLKELENWLEKYKNWYIEWFSM